MTYSFLSYSDCVETLKKSNFCNKDIIGALTPHDLSNEGLWTDADFLRQICNINFQVALREKWPIYTGSMDFTSLFDGWAETSEKSLVVVQSLSIELFSVNNA